MPLQECKTSDATGWRWGDAGACYTGADAKQKALAQAVAMGELKAAEATKLSGAPVPPLVSSRKFQVSDLVVTSEERMEATGQLVKVFDGTGDSLDADGEAMTAADAFAFARAYMLQGRLTGHDDEHDRSSNVASIVEIFVNDERIASPNFQAGAPVVTLRYSDPTEWALVKTKERTGFSFDADVCPTVQSVELLVRPDQVVHAAGAIA